MGYINVNYSKEFNVNCNNTFECLFKYIKKDYFGLIILQFIHIFSIFDRTYLDIYIKNVLNENLFIQLYNYMIISSSLIYFIFFVSKKYNRLIFTTILFLVGTLVVYIPVGLDPRFSSSVFPLLTAITSIYLYHIYKYKKLNFLFMNAVFMFFFFMASRLIMLQMNIGGIWVYK